MSGSAPMPRAAWSLKEEKVDGMKMDRVQDDNRSVLQPQLRSAGFPPCPGTLGKRTERDYATFAELHRTGPPNPAELGGPGWPRRPRIDLTGLEQARPARPGSGRTGTDRDGQGGDKWIEARKDGENRERLAECKVGRSAGMGDNERPSGERKVQEVRDSSGPLARHAGIWNQDDSNDQDDSNHQDGSNHQVDCND